MRSKIASFLFLSFCCLFATAQEEPTQTPVVKAQDTTLPIFDYKPLKPAKVAFYAAVLPGLGQAANGDYWKIPIVYGALGTGVGIAIWNQNEFQRYRTAYKLRIAGRIDEFTNLDENGNVLNFTFTETNLLDAQELFRRNKDLSILITAGLYILQIVEANVRAHLSQYDVDERLSLTPFIDQNTFDFNNTVGLRLTYTF
ncbi:MAG: DUF5683 domain-containing protein [Leeuwenhoekiella sp.]